MQFTELGRHKHIEGMEHITAGFETILEEIWRKPYDLLDASRSACSATSLVSSTCRAQQLGSTDAEITAFSDHKQCSAGTSLTATT